MNSKKNGRPEAAVLAEHWIRSGTRPLGDGVDIDVDPTVEVRLAAVPVQRQTEAGAEVAPVHQACS